MKNSIILLLTLVVTQMNAQEIKKTDITGVWELDWVFSGFFPNDDVDFKKAEGKTGQYIFNFEKGGTISQDLGVEGIGECPVGFFTLTKGSWNLRNGNLTLRLKGDKIADYNYDYVLVYTPKLENDILKLTLVEVLKKKETK